MPYSIRMKVAVVTPYYKESIDYLWQCHKSVVDQSMDCTHIMVADGHPNPEVERWAVRHISLPYSHGDYGDTAKSIGAVDAIGSGYDAIAFLDADNWFLNNHIESLVNCARENEADFVSSYRYHCRLDGSLLGECLNSDAVNFADTNCMFFTRNALRIAAHWFHIPPEFHAICDRVMWRFIQNAKVKVTHTGISTVCYRLTYPGVYRSFGEEPPEGCKEGVNDVAIAVQKWKKMGWGDLTMEVKGRKFSEEKTKLIQQQWMR